MISNGSKTRILIVDDDPSIRRLLRISLEMSGFEVVDADSGEGGLVELAHGEPAAVVLDINLPDISGIEFLKRAREWSSVPVMVLTIHSDDDLKVTALDLGADHFLTKPSSMGELLARIRVMLRRTKKEDELPTVRFGNVVFDIERVLLTRSGVRIKLSAKEHALLRLLALNQGKVVTHRHILREIWGPESVARTPYLHVYMSKLRSKLEEDPAAPKYLKTEPSIGFRLVLDES
jgi:two-component system KDP operon response regulator KdpE